MQLYAWAGQRAAALHQYRECVQVLEQELGVAPLEETTRLYQAIKENQPPPRPAVWHIANERFSVSAGVRSESGIPPTSLPTAAPAPAHSVASSPLVGRATEWAILHRAYAASRDSGQMMIIEGEAGIGKTRLAEEFLAALQRSGTIVLTARCYEGETHLAYGPIVAAIRAAIAQKGQTRWLESIPALWVSEAARLLPELATLRPNLAPAPALDSPGAQSRFFEGLRQIILALCQGAQPGVFYVDDLHWADEATLDLMTYLARRLHEHPLCLLCTWRSEQMAIRPRLRQILQETQRSGQASHLLPGRFSQDMVRELVQSVAAEQLGLAERLYQETEGIPLFLIHYLSALTSGVLKAEAHSWSLPGGVRDLLHSRLAPVSETGWQLLTTAAVIGRAFEFDTLREASGRSEEEAITALEELLSQSLIYELRGDPGNHAINYDFTHEKLRELVYEETSLARRRLLHRRVAEALTSRARGSRESSLAGLIASHFRLAGNEAGAAHYYQLAGERARSLYANAEALNHFQTALALGHPDPTALHEAIGDLHTLQGEYSAALQSYETAAALAMPEALAQLEHKLATVYERRGEWELAESHFEAALAALGEQGPAAAAQSRLYADWSRAAHRRGQTQQALDLAGRALALAETAQDTRALAQAHNILGILASSQHDLETARQHLEQSLALAKQLNDLGARAAALNNLAFVSEARGDTEHALEQAEAALALCVALGDRHREAALHNNLADLLHHAGRTEAAMPHLTQAVRIYAEIEGEAGTLQPEIWKLSEW
jgi:predicted ATPase